MSPSKPSLHSKYILYILVQYLHRSSFDTRIAPLLRKSTLRSGRRRADIHRMSCAPQFYTHSESVDFPRKITGSSIKDWRQSSCVCGSTSQSSYPASRNEFWPFDPCIISFLREECVENDSKSSIGQRRELASCAAQQQLWKKWIGTYGE